MIPTGNRPNGEFYLPRTYEALLNAGVPSESIIVMNIVGENNTQLVNYFRTRNSDNNNNKAPSVVVHRRPGRGKYANGPPVKGVVEGQKHVRTWLAAADNADRQRYRNHQALDQTELADMALDLYPNVERFVLLEDDAVYAYGEESLCGTGICQIARIETSSMNE